MHNSSGSSDVVKPGSKAWEGSAFLKGECFPSLLPFCICFSEDFGYGFTTELLFVFIKMTELREPKRPRSSSYSSLLPGFVFDHPQCPLCKHHLFTGRSVESTVLDHSPGTSHIVLPHMYQAAMTNGAG